MSCKSAIYCVNTSVGSPIANGGTYSPTTVVRRLGDSIQMSGSGVNLRSCGFYVVNVSATVEGLTATTPVTATVYQDGVPVQGMNATQTVVAVNDEVTLNINGIVRVMCRRPSELTVVISGQSVNSVNLGVNIEKE